MNSALFSGTALWFTLPALLGTGIFAIRLLLMLVAGVDHHAGGLDFDTHAGDAHHSDSTAGAKILTVQSVAAFIMGFGWGGLGAVEGCKWDTTTSVAVAVICGVGMTWLLFLLLRGIHSLHTSGNVHIDAALGGEGQVYTNVPSAGQGRGQVRVIISGRSRIYNAVASGEAIGTGSRVRVVRVNQDNTLTVAPA